MYFRNLTAIGRLIGLFVSATVGWQVFEATAEGIPANPCCGPGTGCSGCVLFGFIPGQPPTYVDAGSNHLKQCSSSTRVPPGWCAETRSVICKTVQNVPTYSDDQCTMQVGIAAIGIVSGYTCELTGAQSCP